MEAHDSPKEAAGAPPTPNGTVRPSLTLDPAVAAEIASQLKLARAALEEVDMRLATVQAGTFLIVGLVVILLILEAREIRSLAK